MANEIRLRTNNVSGTITDNPLTNVATTINSPGFVDLPTVTSVNHLIVILDPLELNGPAEIVTVTAHTAASSSVTVTRGAEGSAARTHAVGTTWFHGPVVSDWNYTDRLALSSNRPASPFTGQMIYETDTKKLMVYNGTDWNPNQAGGQLGYAQVTTSQGGIGGGAAVDLTNLTTTVTVGTNRRIKITAYGTFGRTVNDGTSRLNIQEGATVLAFSDFAVPFVGDGFYGVPVSYVTTPTPGSHTYKLSLVRVSGTGTTGLDGTATQPSFILVEDIGAV